MLKCYWIELVHQIPCGFWHLAHVHNLSTNRQISWKIPEQASRGWTPDIVCKTYKVSRSFTAYIPQDNFSSSQDSYASQSIASINSLEIEEIDIVQASGTAPPTATVTHSEVSDLPSNVVDSSEVENLRAKVKRYQEELESYSNKMEKFQDLL
jgi:hypothetical protein